MPRKKPRRRVANPHISRMPISALVQNRDQITGSGFFDDIGRSVTSFGTSTSQFFKGEKSAKPSQVLTGISGIALVGTVLQPELAPILGPISAITLGVGRVASVLGSGLPAKRRRKTKAKRKKKRGRPRKK